MINILSRLFGRKKTKKKVEAPYQDTSYMCESCGNETGEEDYDGFCFHCHEDDWLHIEVHKRGRKYFEKMCEYMPMTASEERLFNEEGYVTYEENNDVKWRENRGMIVDYKTNDLVYLYKM